MPSINKEINIRLAVIIPAYEPTVILEGLIKKIASILSREDGIEVTFVVINDGSQSNEAIEVFQLLSNQPTVNLLHHRTNEGKGSALKTGFRHAIDNAFDFVVTADADGQHTAEDISNIAFYSIKENKVILGRRQFSSEIPFRSLIGNLTTKVLFKAIFRKNISDTQCGLRAFPATVLPGLIKLPQNRYDYEFQSLISIVQKTEITEIDIETVYEPGNPSSHFHPLRDSSLIYLVFLRYIFFVPMIAVLDISLFWFLSKSLEAPLAFAFVRAITLVIYFFTMRHYVFKNKKNLVSQSLAFFFLAMINVMVISYILNSRVVDLLSSTLWVYIFGNCGLFVLNFLVQRYVIFNK